MIRIGINEDLSLKKRINRALGASGLLMALLLPLFLNPERVNFVSCLFHRKTGHDCLTCGLSRSFYAISHLHLVESFKFHLMGPIIYFVLILLFFKFSVEMVLRKEIQIRADPVITRTMLVMFFGIWICFWLIRFF